MVAWHLLFAVCGSGFVVRCVLRVCLLLFVACWWLLAVYCLLFVVLIA